jgi:hypothetical protein
MAECDKLTVQDLRSRITKTYSLTDESFDAIINQLLSTKWISFGKDKKLHCAANPPN